LNGRHTAEKYVEKCIFSLCLIVLLLEKNKFLYKHRLLTIELSMKNVVPAELSQDLKIMLNGAAVLVQRMPRCCFTPRRSLL
jgi:hypothetical protein